MTVEYKIKCEVCTLYFIPKRHGQRICGNCRIKYGYKYKLTKKKDEL